MFKILLPTDGSAGADEAANFASALCDRLADCHITVLHVIDSAVLAAAMAPPLPEVFPHAFNVTREAERAGLELLEDARKMLHAGGHLAATRLVVGSPARVICQVAEKEKFDLVVMGHGGKRRFVHILLRSVADRVAHTCSIPVVIVGNKDE
jgi:nucleotide-binding universal stress UspA family protein